MTALAINTKAPHFTLHATPDQKISLSDFKDQPIILAFYPADWSPICSRQLHLYNKLIPQFLHYQAQLLAISVDSVWSHIAFKEQCNLHFPLLSDFEPKGKVSQAYGVYCHHIGNAERTLFLIDRSGMIKWCEMIPRGIVPETEGLLNALYNLN